MHKSGRLYGTRGVDFLMIRLKIAVKVVDIFGNDTMKIIEVTV
jgi:hypothetical protein